MINNSHSNNNNNNRHRSTDKNDGENLLLLLVVDFVSLSLHLFTGTSSSYTIPTQVLKQLRACGVVETIRISQCGHPCRLPYRSFADRFALLIKVCLWLKKISLMELWPCATTFVLFFFFFFFTRIIFISHHQAKQDETPEQFTARLLQTVNLQQPSDSASSIELVRFGKTKVFLHDSLLVKLEIKRKQLLSSTATVIQSAWRMKVARAEFVKLKR